MGTKKVYFVAMRCGVPNSITTFYFKTSGQFPDGYGKAYVDETCTTLFEYQNARDYIEYVNDLNYTTQNDLGETILIKGRSLYAKHFGVNVIKCNSVADQPDRNYILTAKKIGNYLYFNNYHYTYNFLTLDKRLYDKRHIVTNGTLDGWLFSVGETVYYSPVGNYHNLTRQGVVVDIANCGIQEDINRFRDGIPFEDRLYLVRFQDGTEESIEEECLFAYKYTISENLPVDGFSSVDRVAHFSVDEIVGVALSGEPYDAQYIGRIIDVINTGSSLSYTVQLINAPITRTLEEKDLYKRVSV